MLQSHGLREFWFITQEPEFSQIWDLCRNKANNINFHLTSNQEKSNDKIGPICQFLEKNKFSRKNWALSPFFILQIFTIMQKQNRKS